jgi:hypothetical protein
LLEEPFTLAQRFAHSHIEILLVPRHPEPGLPGADLLARGLQGPLAERPLPLGVVDHAVDDGFGGGVWHDRDGMLILRGGGVGRGCDGESEED